jgi:hypothetical protein
LHPLYSTARSSRGQDTRFSFLEQGFDSPTGYKSINSSLCE